MFKKLMSTLLALAFLFPSVPAFADHWDGGHRGGFHRDIVVHRLPPGYVALTLGGLSLLYSAGMFYRYTHAGYVVVTPPVGAVVPAIPPGYTTVIENGAPYYYYGYTYYTPVSNGYVVAAPPTAPALPQMTAPAAVQTPAPAPSLAPTPATPPHPALYETPKDEDANRNVYDIYIPNGNGSFTSISLRKTEKGFLGPQGEFYPDHPTVEQLRERYTKK